MSADSNKNQHHQPDLSGLPSRLAQRQDYLFSSFFILIWLLPIFWVGFTKRSVPNAGNFFNDLYRVSCLFTHRVSYWNNSYIQVQLEGSESWLTPPESDFAKMTPFGHRTRLHRMLNEFRDRKTTDRLWGDMAEFVKVRFESRYPELSEVKAVRFVLVRYDVGSEIAKPSGHWQKPPYDQTNPKNRYLLAKYQFDN
ncbi:MAG: hypothetical protein QNJ33_06145 [Crocosphaera sp.]|nr:hypothetical protein [Crocosphaera sp.]